MWEQIFIHYFKMQKRLMNHPYIYRLIFFRRISIPVHCTTVKFEWHLISINDAPPLSQRFSNLQINHYLCIVVHLLRNGAREDTKRRPGIYWVQIRIKPQNCAYDLRFSCTTGKVECGFINKLYIEDDM